MAQNIRITITPEIEKSLQILRQSTMGALNTTELIKMAIGGYANTKIKDSTSDDISPDEWDRMAAKQFYSWAKEDGTLNVDNIASHAKMKTFVPEPYVPDR